MARPLRIEFAGALYHVHRDDATAASAIDIGTRIQTQGDLTLAAWRDLNARAANVTAEQGNLTVTAGRDLTLTAGQARIQLDEAHRHKGGGFLSKKTRTTRDSLDRTSAQATTLSGNRVTVLAGRNIAIQGGDVVADDAAQLTAGANISIEATTNTSTETHFSEHQKTGLTGSGRKRTIEATNRQSTLTASTIAGAAGVSLTAPGVVGIAASHLTAPDGDIRIEGGAVSIRSGLDQSSAEFRETRKKTGINIHDLTGTFKPGEGVGFKSALAQENAGASLAAATLDAQNIAIRSTTGDLVLTAVEANARGQAGAEGTPLPGTITLDAADTLTLASLTTTAYQSTDRKKKDLAWQSAKGSGTLDETTRYTELNAARTELAAGHRITADMGVRDSVATLARTPGMAWLQQLDDPALAGKVDWQSIEEAHQHWDYKQQGLTPAAAVVVAVAVAYFTAGAGSAALGTTTATAAGSTTTLAGTTLATTAVTATGATVTTYTAAGAALNAAVTTLASQTAVSVLNNKGDLGKTLDDLGKSENVKALATAMVTAGALQSLNSSAFMHDLKLDNITAQSKFPDQLQKNLINQSTSAVINHAMYGGDLQQMLEQSLKSAFIDTGAAQGANLIGDMKVEGDLNAFTHQLAHAIAGCAAGAARADDCSSGALGAVVGEISAELYGGDRSNGGIDQPGFKTDTVNFARMMAGIAVAITGGDAEAINLAAGAGGNAAENNWLNHNRPTLLALSEKEKYDQANTDCSNGNDAQCGVARELDNLSAERDRQLNLACSGGASSECTSAAREAIIAGNTVFAGPDGRMYAISKMEPILSAPDDPRNGTFHQAASANLSQSLPVAAAIIAPEILGVGNMAAGATLGAGFDAAGQALQPGNEPYRPGQTVVAGITGAFALPLGGSSIVGDAILGGMTGAINTAATNNMYDRNDSVVLTATMGSVFGSLGYLAGNAAHSIAASRLPTNIGATYVNPSLPLFQQTIDFGRLNPYPNYIGQGVGGVVGGLPSIIPLANTQQVGGK